jgi:hypothetical protein
MNEVTVELKRRSDTFQFSALESAHNIMDYFEDNLEVVMLPPSEESLRYAAEEASAYMTLKRMLDLTYRLNAGVVQYSVGSVRSAGEPWVLLLHKHLHPGQIRVRVSIIRVEAFNTSDESDSKDFLENDDLTGLDRRLISAGRYTYSTGQRVTRPVTTTVAVVYDTAAKIVAFPGTVVTQVKSLTLKDVQISGLRASTMAFEGIAERSEYFKKSEMFNNLITWTAKNEKVLVGAQE